jgi:hypothetical protein
VLESIGFEVVPHPPSSPVLPLSDFCLFRVLKKNLKGSRITCGEEIQLLWQNGFKKRLQNSTLMGSKNLFSAGGIVLNERGTAWEHEV